MKRIRLERERRPRNLSVRSASSVVKARELECEGRLRGGVVRPPEKTLTTGHSDETDKTGEGKATQEFIRKIRVIRGQGLLGPPPFDARTVCNASPPGTDPAASTLDWVPTVPPDGASAKRKQQNSLGPICACQPCPDKSKFKALHQTRTNPIHLAHTQVWPNYS